MSAHAVNQRILVGVDGSAPSNRAVRWAAREAATRNLPLTLVHGRNTLTAWTAEMAWPTVPLPEELTRRQEEEAQQVLADSVKVAEGELEASRIDTKLVFSAPIPDAGRAVH